MSRERGAPLSMSTARTLVVAGMVGAGREGSMGTMRELPETGRCSWPRGPKSRPAAVRALIVAMKRVTTVERRGVGRGKQRGGITKLHTQHDCSQELKRWVASRYFVRPRLLRAKVGNDHGTVLILKHSAVMSARSATRPLDWRAGCGNSARPVRREGQVLSLPLPLSQAATVFLKWCRGPTTNASDYWPTTRWHSLLQ